MRISAIDRAAKYLGNFNHPVLEALREVANLIKGTPGSKGAATLITWAPNGTGDASTWADVMVLVAEAASRQCPVVIDCVQSSTDPNPIYQIPPGTYSFPFGSVLKTSLPGDASLCVVVAADGVVFENLFSVSGGLKLRSQNSVLNAFKYTAPWVPVLIQENGAQLELLGAAPAINVATLPGNVMGFAQFNSGPQTGPGKLIVGGAGSQIVTTFVDSCRIQPDSIAAPALSTWVIQHNGCVPSFDIAGIFPNFLGTPKNVAMTQLGGAGPTALRPQPLFGPVMVGTIFRNTEIGVSEVCLDNAGLVWEKQVNQTFIASAEALDALTPGAHVLPPGYSAVSLAGPLLVPAMAASQQQLTTLVARIRQGNIANAGRNVDVVLVKNGTIIPASAVTLAADDPNPVQGVKDFSEQISPGDAVELAVVISGVALPAALAGISGTCI